MFGDRPSKYDYEHGNVGRLGYMDDNRQYTGNDLTDTNREMLQDMIVAAVNEALRKAESSMAESMSKITGGIGGLGGFGF